MNIKSFICVLQRERELRERYPDIEFRFYYSKRKKKVHMGLKKKSVFLSRTSKNN